MFKPFYIFSSVIAVGFSLLLGLGSVCDGAIVTWDGAGGDTEFTNPDNWNSPPMAGDDAEVSGGFTVTYTAATDFNDLSSVVFDDAIGSPIVSGGNLDLLDVALTLQGGTTATVNGRFRLGHATGSLLNEFTITGDASLLVGNTSNLIVGRRSVANFTQSGNADVDVTRNLNIGNTSAPVGSSYNMEGGTLTVDGRVNVRNGSSFNISGGDTTVGGRLLLRDAGTTMIVSGASSTLSILDNLRVQNSAAFEQTAGMVSVSGDLSILSGGSYSLSGPGGAGGGRLATNGSIITENASSFEWNNGGTLEAFTAGGDINVTGDLTASTGAILDLNGADEELIVTGNFIASGLIIDGYDLMFEDLRQPSSLAIGSDVLISANLFGTSPDITFNFSGFDGAADETGVPLYAAYTPSAAEDVYWFQIDGGELSVHWHLQPIPEPHSILLLALSSGALLMRRRR